jgi:hypothetical protein
LCFEPYRQRLFAIRRIMNINNALKMAATANVTCQMEETNGTGLGGASGSALF